jgi:hypothetical protein
MGPRDHFVQFWETHEMLVHAVGGYIGSALSRGDAGIVIATLAHRVAFEAAMVDLGVDVGAAKSDGRYVALDAAAVVANVVVDGLPDAGRFEETVGGIVARMAESGWRVRAFGEAVAVLVDEGHRAAAVRLEELWNDLGRHREFSLFCAYPLLPDLDSASLGAICRQHSGVIPGESFASIEDGTERLQAVVGLQQRVKALEAEVRKRVEVEQVFLRRLRGRPA